jgi:xylose isomerase
MAKTKSNRVPKQKMSGAFPTIECIPYEGPKSTNPLAFKHYNAGEIVEGRTMREHLRFSVVYWHTFRGTGSDPFGAGTMLRPCSCRLRIYRKTGSPLLRLA